MGHRPKCKCKTINILEITYENLDDLKFNDDILDTTSKAWSMKDTTDNLYLKTEKIMIWERLSREWEDMILWYRQRKYLQKIYMIKDFYPKYKQIS